jgi:hypothetical protein
MSKTTKRVSFTLTKTFTYTVDMPGWSNLTDNQALEQANLPNGSNTLGELLAGSSANNGTIIASGKVISAEMTNNGTGYTSAPTVSFNGGGGSGATATAVLSGTTVAGVVITNQGSGYTSAPTVSFSGGGGTNAAATAYISTWSVSGASTAIEQYSMYTNSYAYTLGQQITGTSPTNRLYVCKTAGTTGTSEPTWDQTIGNSTTAGTASFITVDKFVTVITFAISTAYTLGQIVKPTAGSAYEFVVTAAGTSAATSPTWPTTIGGSVTSGTATFLCRSIG